MLEDVRDVRSFLEPLDEPTWVPARALVELQARNCLDQTVVETGDLVGCDFFQCTEPHVAGNNGCQTPIVGAAKRADARYFELVRIETDCFGYGSGHRWKIASDRNTRKG